MPLVAVKLNVKSHFIYRIYLMLNNVGIYTM